MTAGALSMRRYRAQENSVTSSAFSPALATPATPGIPAGDRPFEELARVHVAPRAHPAHHSEGLDLVSWRRLSEAGLWRAGVPKQLGGHGGTWRHLALRLADVARGGGDLGFVLSLVAHANLVRALTEYGTPWQHERFLHPLLAGEVGASAMTEPQGQVKAVGTSARADGQEPDGWSLTGVKEHVANAPVADHALVLGHVVDLGERASTLFLVDLNAPGVSRGQREQPGGLRSSQAGALLLDSVPVPSTAVLGAPGDGLRTLHDIVGFGRALYGLVATACLEPELRRILANARERRAVGSVMRDPRHVQGRLTDVRIIIETVRATALTGIDALVTGDSEASLRCSIAGFIGSDGLVRAATHLMVLHQHLGGARGAEARVVQDALVAGATADVQREDILDHMLAAQH
ncbi:acyl-CoA dehydrogenase family protein [Streptomyces sp. NPDC007851]|uniref:acyl-CoA dehydrogenase family protein n=1 Tax=Streptomyces sp. NPDC007851 TaxID=3155008 RepID=UPI0033F620F8